MKIVSCNANLELSKLVAKRIGVTLTETIVQKFSDQEIFVEIKDNVRGEDVFVIQPTCYPTNDNIMELLICCDALKRASAKRITTVIPYFGYARQDRKTAPRTPISAKLIANIITEAGANRVLTIDLHAGQIQGFFDIPVDNLYAAPLFIQDIKNRFENKDIVVISPDVGGVIRARQIAKKVNSDLAIVDKRREKAGISEVMNIIGDVKDKHCIMVDDIVDSAGTLCNASEALIKKGALSVSAYVTHGVLSGKALDRINNSSLSNLFITNTINISEEIKKCDIIKIISVETLLSEAIIRISQEKSVSSLFDY